MSVGWQLAFFSLGLATGWGFPIRRRKPLESSRRGGETLDQSLARLTAVQSFPRGSGFAVGHQPKVQPGHSPAAPRVAQGPGQVVMGPQQPRPQVQQHIPSAPPRAVQPDRRP